MTTFHTDKLPTIYIGYDPKEDANYQVLRHSILKNTTNLYNIVPLSMPDLRRSGLYRRAGKELDGKIVDTFDDKPFSTEFSFTRFLVPFLNQNSGMALFMDCDMMLRTDINQLFAEYSSRTDYAVQVVKHNYQPKAQEKMDNQIQTVYRRKNWSSFVLWNCSHPSHYKLTVDDVNTKNGSWLHGFEWLKDNEIGEISERWNWLDGHSTAHDPYNVHFTTGGPAFSNWKPSRFADQEYALEWKEIRNKITINESLGELNA